MHLGEKLYEAVWQTTPTTSHGYLGGDGSEYLTEVRNPARSCPFRIITQESLFSGFQDFKISRFQDFKITFIEFGLDLDVALPTPFTAVREDVAFKSQRTQGM